MDSVSDDALVTMKNSITSMINARNPPTNMRNIVWKSTLYSWNLKAYSDDANATPAITNTLGQRRIEIRVPPTFKPRGKRQDREDHDWLDVVDQVDRVFQAELALLHDELG